jgi:hypothetical protein
MPARSIGAGQFERLGCVCEVVEEMNFNNAQPPTSNTEHPIARKLDVHWMLVVRDWMLDVSTQK